MASSNGQIMWSACNFYSEHFIKTQNFGEAPKVISLPTFCPRILIF